MGHGFNVKLGETSEGKCVMYKTVQLIGTWGLAGIQLDIHVRWVVCFDHVCVL